MRFIYYKKNKHVFKSFNLILILALIFGFFLILFITKHYTLLKNHNENIDQYNNLVEEYNKLNKSFNDLKLNFDEKVTKLKEIESELSNFKSLNLSLVSEVNELKSEKEILMADYEFIKDDLLNFKDAIKESMDWFRENSTINNINDLNRFKLKLKTKCVYCENDYCYIKTACIEHVNSNYLKLQYKDDTKTSKEEDKLQNLQMFIDNKGGDCEDFALFYTAQLRYLIDYIIIEKEKIPIIEAITEANTTVDYYIYGDPGEDGSWYFDKNVKKYLLDENYIYPYVVCGNLYDLQSEEYNGHCAVMITNIEINKPEDISMYLYNSYLIEPQIGNFIDQVRYSGLLGEQNNPGEIYMIITKEDLFINESYLLDKPYLNKFKWYGYQTYLDKIELFQK